MVVRASDMNPATGCRELCDNKLRGNDWIAGAELDDSLSLLGCSQMSYNSRHVSLETCRNLALPFCIACMIDTGLLRRLRLKTGCV